MYQFLAGFIVGLNIGVGVWSLLRMSALQGPNAGETGPVRPVAPDPPRASGDEDWVWVT